MTGDINQAIDSYIYSRAHQLHASGHMSQEELLAMIDRIKPNKIYPVHTENPQLCKSNNGVTCIIEQGKEYTL